MISDEINNLIGCDFENEDTVSIMTVKSDFGTGTSLEVSKVINDLKIRAIQSISSKNWDKSTIDGILKTVKKHQIHPKVSLYGCWIIVHLATSASNRIILNELGATEFSVNTLAIHSTNAWVCLNAINVIVNLAANFMSKLVTLGVLDLLVMALKEHYSTNPDLCESGCRAIVVFVAKSNTNKAAIADKGGCQIIINILNSTTNLKSVDICRWCCEAITHLAEDMTKEEGILACDAVVSVMRTHLHSKDVCRWVCTAVTALAPCNASNEKQFATLDTSILLKEIIDIENKSFSDGMKMKAKKALSCLNKQAHVT